LIADTYLSVGTPIQVAAPELLRLAPVVRDQILARIRANYEFVRRVVGGTSVQCLHTEGGWYAVLRLPRIKNEEQWVISILEETNVLTHPGFFYDFADEAYLVVSLLPTPETSQEGILRIVDLVENQPSRSHRCLKAPTDNTDGRDGVPG
jgi:aspartate/methionine/tyrosine aminotransferase